MVLLIFSVTTNVSFCLMTMWRSIAQGIDGRFPPKSIFTVCSQGNRYQWGEGIKSEKNGPHIAFYFSLIQSPISLSEPKKWNTG